MNSKLLRIVSLKARAVPTLPTKFAVGSEVVHVVLENRGVCEVKREPDAAGVCMTTISIIKEADRSQNNGVNLNTAGWLALKARPGVASPVGGGCDIQLQTLAIFLSPVQCLD